MVDISNTLVSNSQQLDNVDLMGGARVFTITDVTVNEGSEQPLSIRLAEYDRPWKPGVTMRRLLAAIWESTDSDDYIGKKVRLFRDDTVTFGKEKTGGTRISHASHIDKRLVVTLPISKGKFGEFKVEPLVEEAPAPAPPLADRITQAITAFGNGGVTLDQLQHRIGAPSDQWTEDDLSNLNSLFNALKSGETTKAEAFGGEE